MRPLPHLFAALSFCLLALPAVSMAQSHNSWCVTGDPMSSSPGGNIDSQTDTIVAAVCSSSPSCCTTRWNLACVQKAAAWARSNTNVGDYCGRYAWALGPAGKQYYPRDFNLVALGQGSNTGDIYHTEDVNGPIAAAGTITLQYFNLNYGEPEQLAAVGQGYVQLNSGTIHGLVAYGTNYAGTATFVDGSRPTAPTAGLIDFPWTYNKLVAMSQALDLYDSTVPSNRTRSRVGQCHP
jgi:Putative Ice-binding-like adhesive domain